MRYCKHSPDEYKRCTCLMVDKDGKFVCDVYDEPYKELRKCPSDKKGKLR